MARIRTIKPSFFQHGELQDLELAHPGACVMLVYAGLWCQSDKHGVFRWDARHLKLHICPYLPFDMAATLVILAEARQIVPFEHDGKHYGWVPAFSEHQRINGKEAQDDSPYPLPPGWEAAGKHRGSNREAQEGKGREQEGKGTDTEQRTRFDRFWAAYPRKEGKDAAWREWLRRSPDDSLLEIILSQIALQRASQQWADPQFIPHPRTWLHQGRWQDETLPAVQAAPKIAAVSPRIKRAAAAADEFVREG